MRQRHSCKQTQLKWNKSILLLVSAFLIITMTIGGTAAYLVTSTTPLENVFIPSDVTTEVVEKLDGSTKSDVKIHNTGSTDAWIRAAIIVTWKDASGNVYGVAPISGTDYVMTVDLASGWTLGSDGFYYWTLPVDPDASTGVLIRSCTYSANAPDGYRLSVEIIASGIQSNPARVFDETWASSGLVVNRDGTALVVKTGGVGE